MFSKEVHHLKEMKKGFFKGAVSKSQLRSLILQNSIFLCLIHEVRKITDVKGSVF